MNIYIPRHLRRIKVVDQLCQLIEEYTNKNSQRDLITDPVYYFNKYKALSYDPVKRFVGICKTINRDTEITETEEELSSIVNYITEIFYSISGSYKIFDTIDRLLNIKFSNIDYQVEIGYLRLELDIDTYEKFFKINEDLCKSSFLDFLNSLIYFKKVDLIYNEIKLDIEKCEKIGEQLIQEPILYTYYNL